MRSNYEVRAQKFIEKLYPFVMGYKRVTDLPKMVGMFNMKYHRHVEFAYGATRVCFITSDYVVKMDYAKKSRFGTSRDEYEVYQQAVADGMSYLFAKITPYEYNGVTFYIMPRVSGIAGKRSSGYDVDMWLRDEEVQYLDDCGIYDLHCYNYGWKDNHPILIDYAAVM